MLDNIVKYSDNEKYKKKCPDNFLDWYCAAMIQHYSDRFLQLTDDMKLPEFFDAKKEDIGQLVKLLRWLEDMATTVYVKSEFVNQFFLLHGITGTWIWRYPKERICAQRKGWNCTKKKRCQVSIKFIGQSHYRSMFVCTKQTLIRCFKWVFFLVSLAGPRKFFFISMWRRWWMRWLRNESYFFPNQVRGVCGKWLTYSATKKHCILSELTYLVI